MYLIHLKKFNAIIYQINQAIKVIGSNKMPSINYGLLGKHDESIVKSMEE